MGGYLRCLIPGRGIRKTHLPARAASPCSSRLRRDLNQVGSFFLPLILSNVIPLFASMTPETAAEIVYEALLGSNSIPQQLRAKQGLDQRQFDQLTTALRWLTHHYAARPVGRSAWPYASWTFRARSLFAKGFTRPPSATKLRMRACYYKT
jgi:hypothetical protein